MGSACSADSGVREGGPRRGSDAAARPQPAGTRQLHTSGGGGAADDRPPTPNRQLGARGDVAGPAPSTPLLGLLPARRPLSIHTPSTPDLSGNQSARFSWHMPHPEILALDITAASNPTRYLELERQRLSVPQTPTGKEAELYRFFCPVCMLYFKEIYKTSCCSNNVCLPCALSHVKQRSTDPAVESWLGLPSNQSFAGVGCPLCNLEGVQFSRVATSERARNYQESPMTKDLFKAIEARNRMELGPQPSSMHQLTRSGTLHKTHQSAVMRSTAASGPSEHDHSSNSAAERSQSGTGSFRGLRNHAVAELRADMRQHHSLAADPELEVEHDEDIASPSTRAQQAQAGQMQDSRAGSAAEASAAAASSSAAAAGFSSSSVAASSSSSSSSAAVASDSSIALIANGSSSSLPPRPRSGSSRPSSRQQLPADSSRPPRGPSALSGAVAAAPASRSEALVDGGEAGEAMESVPLSSSSSSAVAAASALPPVHLRLPSSPLGGADSGRPQGWTAVPDDHSEHKFDSGAVIVSSSSSSSSAAVARSAHLGVQLPGDDDSLRGDALFLHSPHAKELRAKELLYVVDPADSSSSAAAASSSGAPSTVPRQRSQHHHAKAPSISLSISSPVGPPMPASHSPVLAPLPAAAAASTLALLRSNSDLLLEESFSFDGSASFMQEHGQHAAVHPADSVSMQAMQQASPSSSHQQPPSNSNEPSPTAAAS